VQKSEALHAFVDMLDNTMERSIARTNPADAGAFPQARRDYKNALVIEDAAKTSNVAGAQGYITPAKLEAAAKKVYGARAHERGYDPFDWAPSAKAVLKVEPNSGTAHRMHVSDIINKITAATGALGGAALGSHTGAEGSTLGLLVGAYGAAPLIEPLVRKGVKRVKTGCISTFNGS
jgi:hypothetical protein